MLIFFSSRQSFVTVDGAKKFIHCLFHNSDSESYSEDGHLKATKKNKYEITRGSKIYQLIVDDSVLPLVNGSINKKAPPLKSVSIPYQNLIETPFLPAIQNILH